MHIQWHFDVKADVIRLQDGPHVYEIPASEALSPPALLRRLTAELLEKWNAQDAEPAETAAPSALFARATARQGGLRVSRDD